MPIIAFILGGLARVLDGTGKVKGSVWVMVCVAFAAGLYVTFDYLESAIIALGCGIALQRGFNGWTSFSLVQITHYYAVLPFAIFVGQIDFLKCYVVALTLAGLAHPVLAFVSGRWFPTWHYTRYAEFVAGALVIGPWAIL